MSIELLKKVISEQREEISQILERKDLVERENTNFVKKFLEHPNILAILGVRRCGKSTFAMLLANKFKEKIGYIDFDDERLIGLKTEDLNNVLQAFYELYGDFDILILDEMQNVHGWELFANRLRRTKRIILTGSNSNLLSGELATHLTGRYIDFLLYPFSFREILDFKPDLYLTKDVARVRSELKNYVEGSAFPEFTKLSSKIVVKIYEDIINKDCLRRHEIREEQAFRELAKYLTSNFSCEFTYSKLSKIVGIKDVHTIKNYTQYLKEAFLIVVLERYSPKLKQQVIAPKKVYNIDHGLCNFVGFQVSKNTGRIWENIVCIELLRKRSIRHFIEIYYWKSAQQDEVDFIIKEKNEVKQLIQVCYEIENSTTKEREIKSLLKASKELRCNNLLIITQDSETEETIENKKIRCIPLWKWLLTN